MVLNLKKSRITDWWVTTRNDPMNFLNIFSKNNFKGDFVVVGYLDNTKELAHSTNSVIRITKEGVITAQGSFYPFKEAHPLYLKFLLKANKNNTIIASYWDFEILDETSFAMIADISTPEGIKKEVTFDFIPDKNSTLMFSGHSNELSSDIVLCTFRRKGYCSIIGIPDAVKYDVYNSSIIFEDDLIKLLKEINELFNKKFNNHYISVDLS